MSDADATGRRAQLILVTPDGAVVGALPALSVDTPWWQHVEPVVERARRVFGVEVVVLRLLSADRDRPPGGQVTYLAEIAEPAPATPWRGTLEDHPLRLDYARPGGPAADLAWAETALAARGLRLAGKPVQVRTWNLSSLWRLPLGEGAAWLKCAPPFMHHEGPLLRRLVGARTPAVLGCEGGRTLLADIPGQDLHDPTAAQATAMVDLLVDLQRAWSGRISVLLGLGVPDWRAPALIAAIADVVDRTRPELLAEDAALLDRFVEDLPRRMAEVDACGLPDTLVHGDFHPGNVRGEGLDLMLLDWGDAAIGHPLLDQTAFLDRLSPDFADAARARWLDLWRQACPGADPARAEALLAPVAAARLAAVYRRFLDRTEPSEHPYHRADPADWLRRTAALLPRG